MSPIFESCRQIMMKPEGIDDCGALPWQKEWLNLRLGGREVSKEGEAHTGLAPTKVFSCNFCMRKFYSSQALGGHQNAHKRERGVVRHYQVNKVMAMMAQPVHNSAIRSLGVQAHALVHKPGRDGSATTCVEADKQGNVGAAEEVGEFSWPVSFQNDARKAAWSDALDLNLKL